MDFELSVTICSWNTIGDLRACLSSLRSCKEEASFEVVVVDNASSDGSADMVAAEFPEFKLIRSDVNLGFTGGHNLAMSDRRGEAGMLLNSDTVVHPGAITTLCEFIRNHADAGIVGPKLLNPDGSLQFSCRRFPNPLAAMFRNTILGRYFPNNRFTSDYLMRESGHDKVMEVDWVSGAALVMSKACIDRIGLLDDKYFMYCEDVDICRRAWDAGFKVMYVPDAVITHAIGRSTDRVANKMIVRFHRSMLRYYSKHQVSRAFVLWRPFLYTAAIIALSLRAGAFLVKNSMDALKRRVTH